MEMQMRHSWSADQEIATTSVWFSSFPSGYAMPGKRDPSTRETCWAFSLSLSLYLWDPWKTRANFYPPTEEEYENFHEASLLSHLQARPAPWLIIRDRKSAIVLKRISSLLPAYLMNRRVASYNVCQSIWRLLLFISRWHCFLLQKILWRSTFPSNRIVNMWLGYGTIRAR